ncbi:MAG: serine protease [Flavobacteriaceae bacterium]|nr:serine protease [Flavobacteriaceae bacterium]|tara:strand:+ start:28374 stop:29753 length:1380 start_codon:yes stop_codon:yes gene_type:complete
MKLFLKYLLIGVLSGFISIYFYNYYDKSEIKFNDLNYSNSIPVNYLYSNKNSISTDFTVAAEKTIDAVVHVKNTSISSSNTPSWYRFFYEEENEIPERIGTGSGVIVSPDGYIITNNHVIDGYSEIEITTNNNKSYKASLIGTDPGTDIAVLKINADSMLPYISFGDSDNTKIGEWVLAVGNPFNLNSTVTAGIISAKSRDLNKYDNKNESYIQTDAAVNKGNSGGALVNTNGQLIGINTAISSVTGGFVGYSFAVPSNVARKVFEDIIEFGDVQKGLLGVIGQALNSDVAEKFGVFETEGFYINEIEKGFGADISGLKPGDIIKSIDGLKINKFADLSGYLSTKRPGQKVSIKYIRNDLEKNVMVILKKINRINFYGMELRELNKNKKEEFNIDGGLIISRMGNERLYRNGINEGHIILEINNKKIYKVSDVEKFSPYDLENILFINPEGEKERLFFR